MREVAKQRDCAVGRKAASPAGAGRPGPGVERCRWRKAAKSAAGMGREQWNAAVRRKAASPAAAERE